MKIGFFLRAHEQWGGDLLAIQSIQEGLKELGVESLASNKFSDIESCDFIFLSNTIMDLNPARALLDLHSIPYGIICFHKNLASYRAKSFALYHFVEEALSTSPSDISHFINHPSLLERLLPPIEEDAHPNYEVLRDARLCVANSPTEEAGIKADCPEARTVTIRWAAGLSSLFPKTPDDSFMKWAGLNEPYLLQVGRLEPRKNQISSILASRNFPAPLVFIGSASWTKGYEECCLKLIEQVRKGQTIYVSQSLPSEKRGNLTIIQNPDGALLPVETLASAYKGAGLLLNPAFVELPGYTYLEALSLGTPVISSTGTTLADYFSSPLTSTQAAFVRADNIKEIEEAIHRGFNKKFTPSADPIYKRTPRDVALELCQSVFDDACRK